MQRRVLLTTTITLTCFHLLKTLVSGRNFCVCDYKLGIVKSTVIRYTLRVVDGAGFSGSAVYVFFNGFSELIFLLYSQYM